MSQDAKANRHGEREAAPALARTMGLGALVIYGVGDMLGSGIYALIGKVAGTMGNAAWLAFAASMVAALLTGLSYASLGSRYPRAAGVAYVAERAFGSPFLSYMVGLTIVASGLTSMATQSRAFAGYLLGLFGNPGGEGAALVVILLFIVALSAVNFRGMRESTWLNLICTTVEAGGLVVIIVLGVRFWGSVDYLETPVTTPGGGELPPLGLVFQGAVLTFYAFVGFEDMINVTEEVKDPSRVFPRAVILALAITTVLYIAVSVTAVSVVPYAELGRSGQPLVDVVRRAAPDFPSGVFSLVALFAITNTALLNYIMGSRMVYGLARQGLLPAALGRVHPRRRTPHRAIAALMGIVIVLAFTGGVAQLASATSVLLLGVFVIVNASLIVLQRRPEEPRGFLEVPALVPAAGIVVCVVIAAHARPEAWRIALGLLGGIAILYAVVRPRAVAEAA